MTLSPEVQQRLDAARQAAPNYQPKRSISHELGGKAIVMLVAPAATGKTEVMKRIRKLDPRFGIVPSFSTREPRRDDDPDLLRLLPHDDESVSKLLDRIDAREVVQYAVHPTQGTIYGTELQDYPSDYNLLATFSGAVDQFRLLNFGSKHTIGLVSEVAAWKGWFADRYPSAHPDRQKRLGEAIISLSWLLDDSQRAAVTFVENVPGNASSAAQEIIDIVLTEEQPNADNARAIAQAMRRWARGQQ